MAMEPNIEFRDASNAVLFRETISGDYPLEDIFNQYYPDSPRSLLFYIQDKIALPKKSTLNGILNQYNFQSLPVVVWAKVPVVANPNHTPQW
ncbi:hypothetical protein H4R22_000858 [Coemansia sp. RSA 1290]|nr:hypothetical protein H4R22_000858 [Coemansia sp. RSA 1290]KAJ2652827.1 hypothetical protein IWW40_000940 [Coemansia sp. RSA 1250]